MTKQSLKNKINIVATIFCEETISECVNLIFYNQRGIKILSNETAAGQIYYLPYIVYLEIDHMYLAQAIFSTCNYHNILSSNILLNGHVNGDRY